MFVFDIGEGDLLEKINSFIDEESNELVNYLESILGAIEREEIEEIENNIKEKSTKSFGKYLLYYIGSIYKNGKLLKLIIWLSLTVVIEARKEKNNIRSYWENLKKYCSKAAILINVIMYVTQWFHDG